MKRKPRMYGCETLRVVTAKGNEEWFYDVVEAVEFVKSTWTAGVELSARVRDGNYWTPVFQIDKEGIAFISPIYSSLLSLAPIEMENAV
jgi:hypothetical protein